MSQNETQAANVQAELETQSQKDKRQTEETKSHVRKMINAWEDNAYAIALMLLSIVARSKWREATKLESGGGKKDRRTFAEVVAQCVGFDKKLDNAAAEVLREVRLTADTLAKTLSACQNNTEKRLLCVGLGVMRKQKDEAKPDVKMLAKAKTGEDISNSYLAGVRDMVALDAESQLYPVESLQNLLETLTDQKKYEQTEEKMADILRSVVHAIRYPGGVTIKLDDGRMITPVHVALETLGIRETGKQYRNAITRAASNL